MYIGAHRAHDGRPTHQGDPPAGRTRTRACQGNSPPTSTITSPTTITPI